MSESIWLAEHDGNRFEIVEDDAVGFYVYRYEGKGPCTTD